MCFSLSPEWIFRASSAFCNEVHIPTSGLDDWSVKCLCFLNPPPPSFPCFFSLLDSLSRPSFPPPGFRDARPFSNRLASFSPAVGFERCVDGFCSPFVGVQNNLNLTECHARLLPPYWRSRPLLVPPFNPREPDNPLLLFPPSYRVTVTPYFGGRLLFFPFHCFALERTPRVFSHCSFELLDCSVFFFFFFAAMWFGGLVRTLR